MSNTHRFSVILTVCLGIVLIFVGLFVLFLFVIPEFKPWGMTGVYLKSRYVTYTGEEVEEVFKQRNLVIECSNTEINIRLRKIGYEDEARIQIFEDANGIAFNSTDRTHVDFIQYLDESGEAYTKILVQEPKGALSRKARIYINLKKDDIAGNDPYNFILNTGKSTVNFEYDASTERLDIDHLQINGTGKVTLPAPLPAGNNPGFNLEINNLDINSNDAWVSCRSKVRSHVRMIGNSRNLVLGEVSTVIVNGTTNNVFIDRIGGDMEFISNYGKLSVYDECTGKIKIETEDAVVSIKKTASLDAKIGKGTMTVNGLGDDNIIEVDGIANPVAAKVVMESGTLTLGTKASGTSELGAYGNVYVEKKYGATNINYANNAAAIGICSVRAMDGNVNVNGVRGRVDIKVSSMGTANVAVGFMEVAEGGLIEVLGSREPLKYGEVAITLLGTSKDLTIVVQNSYETRDYITPNSNWIEFDNNVIYDIGNGSSVLTVRTQSKVEIKSGYY